MNNTKKAIAVLLIILVIIGGVILWFSPWKRSGEGEYSVIITNRATESLQSVAVENEKGTYTVEKKGISFQCAELSEIPVSESALAQLVKNSCEIQAVKTIRDPFIKLEDYGLDVPRGMVQITYLDGTTLSLEIGFDVPDENGCYFKIAGEKKVYVGNKEDFLFFTNGKEQLLSKYLIAGVEKEQQEELPQIIAYSNEKGTVQLQRQATPYVDGCGNTQHWQLAEGTYADDERVASLFQSILQIKSEEIYTFHPTILQFENCGITNSVNKLLVTYQEEKTELTVGNKTGDCYYIYKTGVDVIYVVPEQYITFLEADRFTVETRFVMAPNRQLVESFKIDGKDGALFMVDIAEDGGIVDGQYLKEYTFGSVYQFICSLKGEYLLEEELEFSGDSDVQIVVQYKNGTRDIVSLVPYDTKRQAIFINGEARYLVRTTYAEKLIHMLGQISNGQVIDPTW